MEIALFVAVSDRPVDLAPTAASQSNPAPDLRDQAFRRSCPQSYPVSTPSQQLIGDAQTRWQNSLRAACQDALRVQAGVVQALETSRTETNGLVSLSQSAAGLLQARQDGNQLVALQTRPAVGHDHPA